MPDDKNIPIIGKPQNNPHGFTQADFVTCRDVCLAAGGLLQRFKPGGLDELSKVITKDLQNAKALMLSTVARRRGEALAKLFVAAETFRQAAADAVATMDFVDPNEVKIVEPANE